jgi:hypothetical protein
MTIGRALIHAAEQWAIGQGCTEFGSDSEIDKDVSHAAHLHSGFQKTGRVRTFHKKLDRSDKPAVQYNDRPATGELNVTRCGKPKLPT